MAPGHCTCPAAAPLLCPLEGVDMGPSNKLPIWGAAAIVLVTLALAWWLIPALHPSSDNAKVADQFPNDDFPSTYTPRPSKPTLIRGATVLTATDKEIAQGDVLMVD